MSTSVDYDYYSNSFLIGHRPPKQEVVVVLHNFYFCEYMLIWAVKNVGHIFRTVHSRMSVLLASFVIFIRWEYWYNTSLRPFEALISMSNLLNILTKLTSVLHNQPITMCHLNAKYIDWLIDKCLTYSGKYVMHIQDENKITK